MSSPSALDHQDSFASLAMLPVDGDGPVSGTRPKDLLRIISLIIVPPGMIEEMVSPDELMDVRDEDEDEIDDDISVSFIPADRRRSRAPSPPSLPPSHPVSRFATPQRDEETDSARHFVWM